MKRFILLLCCTLALAGTVRAKTPDQLRNEFINDMVKRHGFKRDDLTKTLHQAVTQKRILEAISRPAEKTLNWTEYRAIFLKPERIHGGVDFWRQHADTLARAEKEYGVPPQIIVAILGVETRYGAFTGGHRVLDALHTLGFHYPRRGEFFREQLSHFLRFAKEEDIAPTMPTGSYAGAMGMPQFMPDSFRVYAVDFDGDGHRDIWENPVDVIGSVANYFVKKGNWKRGGPVTTPASSVTGKHKAFVDAGAKPRLTATQLSSAGIKFDDSIATGGKVSLMDFKTDTGTEYWVGSNNFYSIMRYNPRTKYAMAVYQLSEAILAEYQQGLDAQKTAGKQP
ncbi:lytic murein transglycosylase B [Thiosocius teredinicola]|uniref:lytic murein transglycosylase B n=1 Tax=Thiosocius teredinicola TaxID=1973002 RepID=UPI0009910C7B